MISLEVTGIKELQRKLNPERFQRANRRILNRAGDQGYTFLARSLGSEYTVKQKYIRPKMKKEKATSFRKRYRILIDSDRLLLSYFRYKKGKQTGPLRSRTPLRAQFIKGGPMIPYRGAFVIEKFKNKVYKRVSSKRFPLTRPRAWSIPHMIEKKELKDKMFAFVVQVIHKRTNLELERLCKK